MGVCAKFWNCYLLMILLPTVLSSTQGPATAVPKWLPMQIGDRWIYEEEILSGARKRPDVSRWEQEDRTVAIQKVSEGLLVRRTVRFLNNTAPPTYIGSSSESNILVHHGCIYYVNDSASFDHGYGWDSSSSELSGSFRNDLANDKPLPDVCLPPRAGQTLGESEGGSRSLDRSGIWPKTSG